MPRLWLAIGRAARDLAVARVIAVLFLPMLGAIVLWSVLAFVFWDDWTGAFRSLVEGTAAAKWLVERSADWVLTSAGWAVAIALVIPATLLTAILATELVAMPVIVSVAGRSYPGLEKKSGGTVAGSVSNAILAAAIFGALWLVTLPLWLTGIGALVVPALNSAYLNQRLFRYDALSEHASREEYRELVARNRWRLFGLGLMLAPMYYVPVLNLAAPVITGLAFTHYCLAELARLRVS